MKMRDQFLRPDSIPFDKNKKYHPYEILFLKITTARGFSEFIIAPLR